MRLRSKKRRYLCSWAEFATKAGEVNLEITWKRDIALQSPAGRVRETILLHRRLGYCIRKNPTPWIDSLILHKLVSNKSFSKRVNSTKANLRFDLVKRPTKGSNETRDDQFSTRLSLPGETRHFFWNSQKVKNWHFRSQCTSTQTVWAFSRVDFRRTRSTLQLEYRLQLLEIFQTIRGNHNDIDHKLINVWALTLMDLSVNSVALLYIRTSHIINIFIIFLYLHSSCVKWRDLTTH